MLTRTRIDMNIERPTPVEFFLNDLPVTGYPGETVATALLASGVVAFRYTSNGQPRSPVCNMGVCFECLVLVEDLGWVRGCMTPVRAGMKITIGGRTNA